MTFSALLIMTGVRQIQIAALPGPSQLEVVEIVTQGDIISEVEGEHVGEIRPELRFEYRPEIALPDF